MRHLGSWKLELIRDLRLSTDIPNALCDVELGLTLATEVCPNEPPDVVPALLSGNVIPGMDPEMLPPNQRAMIARARVLLRVQGHTRWTELLQLYRSQPEIVRLFDVNPGEPARPKSSSVRPDRREIYLKALNSAPPFETYSRKPAAAGTYHFYVRDEHEPGPYEWHSVTFTEEDIGGFPGSRPRSLSSSRTDRGSLKVSWDDLKATAAWMDQQSHGTNWSQRFDRMDLVGGTDRGLTITGLYHLVGMVGSGKSTLMDVLAVWAARSGLRTMLVVGDNVDATTRVETFRALGLNSVPLMGLGGRQRRREQLERVANQSGRGWKDPRLKWASPVCPLLGFGASDVTDIPPGSEPCESLHQERDQNSNQRTCPLMPACPVHSSRSTMMDADIWVGTPQSLVLTRAPEHVIEENVRLLEVVYRECDLVIVDEADRVQTQLDEMFAPSVTLVGTQGNGLMEVLDRSAVVPLGGSLGRTMASSDVFEWKAAQSMSFQAVSLLLLLCSSNKNLKDWITQRSYFTAFGLADQLHWELSGEMGHGEIMPELMNKFLHDPDTDSCLGNLAAAVLPSRSEDVKQARVNDALRWLRDTYPLEEVNKQDEDLLSLKIQSIAAAAVLDNRLKRVYDHWEVGDGAYSLGDGANIPFHHSPRDYQGLVPVPPMGVLFGFRYRSDYDGNPQIDMFRCAGVGRWLLIHLHDMFKDVDGAYGPQVLLLSGSSWAPGSSGYHVRAPVDNVLKPPSADLSAITKSTAFFNYALDPRSFQPIGVSGSGGERRERNLLDVLAFLTDRQSGPSELERELDLLEQQEGSGDCILMVTGSYEETQQAFRFLNGRLNSGIRYLVPDSSPDDERSSWTRGQLRRGLVNRFADGNERVLIAPLMAIERGHNIVEEDGSARIGSVYFLVRPMPVPHEFGLAVRDMNHWAVSRWAERVAGVKPDSVGRRWNEYRADAYRAWHAILRDPGRYRSATPERRRNIAWTQLVALWQTAGRGVRGGSSVRVHFCDAAFAPNSARGERDNEETSLLVAMRKELDRYLNNDTQADGPDDREREVCRSLYEPWAAMLSNIANLHEE